MIPLAAYLEAAMRVARFDRLHPDPAERESAANLAAWQAWQAQTPVELTHTICRRRMIEAWRRDRGRRGQRLAPVSLDATDDDGWSLADSLGSDDPDPMAAAELIDRYGYTPALRRTLERIAAGWRNVDIARADGVTESAIVHRLYKIRNTRRNQ